MDVAIIGAGPVGLTCAYELAKEGQRVTVYEEHARIGRPVQCTGIVTSSIKGLAPFKESVVNRLSKVRITAGRSMVELPAKDLVLDREAFDRNLAERAETLVKIEIGKRLSVVPEADAVIGADGPDSFVRKIINPGHVPRYLVGKQAVVKGSFERDVFEVYLGSVAPGFFAWVVPEDDTTARIGVAASKNTEDAFRKFMGTLNARPISYQAGLIPIHDPRIRIMRGNSYIVGDAALQVKATTGGGLVPGLRSAKILADCLNHGGSYQSRCRLSVGKELLAHLMLRRMLDKFTDPDYEDLIQSLQRLGPSFEKHSRDQSIRLCASVLLREPTLLRHVRKMF
jgi:digeranylgeranylglycerophospholipid reductase